MKFNKVINLYLISLYFITNFLYAISLSLSATSLSELTLWLSGQTGLNIIIIIICIGIYTDMLNQQKEEEKSDL